MTNASGVPFRTGRDIILCADDFAISDGVSRGIAELAGARRISATSAIVTLPGWSGHAHRLAQLRPLIAIGLHVNLTLGAPLGAMPALAPLGRLPSLGDIVRRAVLRRLDRAEIAAEIARQLARFELATGVAPDFIDGHQHVHALPVVRGALLDALRERFPAAQRRALLVRDPADRAVAIWRRGGEVGKALVIAVLSGGFGAAVRRAGFSTNSGFSGVSAFDVASPFGQELARFFTAPGPCHLVMCHPGYPDAELARLDPHTERRRQELEAIMAADGIVAAIWRIDRRAPAGAMWPVRRTGTTAIDLERPA